MRIAWVSFDFFEYSIAHANALSKEHDVLLVLARHANAGREDGIEPGVDTCLFEAPRLRQPIRQLFLMRRLIRRIHAFRPDVVHFQRGHLWFNFALYALGRYPLVVSIHDPRHHQGDSESRKTPQFLIDLAYRRADRVIVHGRSMLDVVRDDVLIPEERIHVIPLIGAVADPIESRAVIVMDVDGPTSVLFFGRIWGYKGLDTLIEAEPMISEKVSDYRITIAGRGEEIAQYLCLMKNPSQFEVINRFIGLEEKARLFSRAALVALPYRSATQSGVVIDAYSFGKPVVATRVGSLAEYVEEGVTGLLVPPDDPQALAESIVSLLLDPVRTREMGRRARQKLIEEYNPHIVANATVAVYRSALDDRQNR